MGVLDPISFETGNDNEEKMFGLLKTRNIGVKKINLLSMWFLQFSSVLALMWTLLYQIYMLQEQVHISKSKLQGVISIAGQISQVGAIIAGFGMGFVYDIYGRKVPLLIFLVASSMAILFFPFIQNEYDFYWATIFILPLHILMSNPWVPDLIEVES